MDDAGPRRGEVWLIAFDGSGGEIRKTRPAVVVSDDASDLRLDRVQVVPVSSRVERLCPAEAPITVGGDRRKAIADQSATVDRARLLRCTGRLGRGGDAPRGSRAQDPTRAVSSRHPALHAKAASP